MANYYTSGQTARHLGISVATLNRWYSNHSLKIAPERNILGWRLFSDSDLKILADFKHHTRSKSENEGSHGGK
jgi:DNA-binding transcriptional MerR regulator